MCWVKAAIKDDQGNLCLSDNQKKRAWKKHYGRLLNVEDPPVAKPVAGPPILVTGVMIAEAISKMKPGKSRGPSGIVADLLKASIAVSNPKLAVNQARKCHHC